MAVPNYVIVPTADILLKFRETMSGCESIHIDWQEVGDYLVASTLTLEQAQKATTLTQEDLDNQEGDNILEFRAMSQLIKDLTPRLQTLGYYDYKGPGLYEFSQWMGEDLVILHVADY